MDAGRPEAAGKERWSRKTVLSPSWPPAGHTDANFSEPQVPHLDRNEPSSRAGYETMADQAWVYSGNREMSQLGKQVATAAT